MAKISVRHSVAEGYGLLFGRPLTVIGLTWLPAVGYAIGAGFLARHLDAAIAASIPTAQGLLGQFAFLYLAAFVVLTAFFGAVIAVPLTRQAFGLREERVAAYFVVGAREFRLFLALLRYYAIVVAALVAFAIVAGIAITQGVHYATAHGMARTWSGVPLETWFNAAAGLLAYIVYGVLAVRYGFFLDAIAAVEDGARLSRAAQLARGNFWSIAGLLLLVGAPAGLVLIACEMTFGGFHLASLGFAPTDATPFGGILAFGLVVLHTLTAGAAAGAYSEMADAAVHEIATAHESVPAHDLSPALVFAHASAQPETSYATEAASMGIADTPPAPEPEASYHAEAPATVAAQVPVAEEMPAAAEAPMEIATPEAASATTALAQAIDWMAPPPDAHFGSDPHDAQPHDAQPPGVQEANASAGEPLPPQGVLINGAHPVEAQNGLAEAIPGTAPEIDHGIDHEAQARAANEQIVGFDGHPMEVPEHAHDAELPAPPLDPAGAMSMRQRDMNVPA